ncbi:MAG: aminotransferase class III-fold pyridoxal phosphate-dependent enzyme [Candidatus Binatia bacterium]
MADISFHESDVVFERAKRVIPGGVYGHQSPALLTPGEYPFFLERSEGCRIRDVDGNEFIDFLCGYGPMVVGYRNPAVERAAATQRERCDSMNLPAPCMVELAERLVALSPGMDWAMFSKNGSDVTTWSLAVARVASGRDIVAMVEGTYHGVHGWCNHLQAGFPDSDRQQIVEFDWNDLGGLEARFRENPGKIAAVIITPFHHEAFSDSVLSKDGFLEGVRDICSREGSVMIVDDVRAGFRLNMGGSTQAWGVTPDVLIYSKALANGYPLAVMLGNDSLKDAGQTVFYTGTFATQAVPIAAALATIAELERVDGIAHMERVGRRLCDGLTAQATEAGFDVTISGPPAIPFMTFDADRGGFDLSRAFAGACVRHGVFLHPIHNWFLSTAHQEADIDEALAATERAFAEIADRQS